MAIDVATSLLAELRKFQSDANIAAYAAAFAYWRNLSFSEQLGSTQFGSDGTYVAPLIYGEQRLRHVHLQPASRDARKAWQASAVRGGPRTSDRALIYVVNAANDLLLVHILKDGTAHAVSRMRNREDREIMEAASHLAEEWLADRTTFARWVQISN